MFCPECRAEYREGFTVCSDCQVDLVATLPQDERLDMEDERPDMELVTVFDSTNPALIGIAKTVLDAAGIDFLVVGDDGARVFSGNPFLARVRLQVEKKLAEEAEALLSEISESEEPLEDEPPMS